MFYCERLQVKLAKEICEKRRADVLDRTGADAYHPCKACGGWNDQRIETKNMVLDDTKQPEKRERGIPEKQKQVWSGEKQGSKKQDEKRQGEESLVLDAKQAGEKKRQENADEKLQGYSAMTKDEKHKEPPTPGLRVVQGGLSALVPEPNERKEYTLHISEAAVQSIKLIQHVNKKHGKTLEVDDIVNHMLEHACAEVITTLRERGLIA